MFVLKTQLTANAFYIVTMFLFFGWQNNTAYGFGPLGHRIVGEIAQQNLNHEVIKTLKLILKNQSLADISTWADEIKSNERWNKSHPWHYVSIEDHESVKNYKKNPSGDIITALQKIKDKLNNWKSLSQDELKHSIYFLVHFAGDIHQPLHVGRSHDLGGNKILVYSYSNYQNLHYVWDNVLIQTKQMSYSEYADTLLRKKAEVLEEEINLNIKSWAQESKDLRDKVYDFSVESRQKYLNVPALKYKYTYHNLENLEKRLLLAGLRLAHLLNVTFKK